MFKKVEFIIRMMGSHWKILGRGMPEQVMVLKGSFLMQGEEWIESKQHREAS